MFVVEIKLIYSDQSIYLKTDPQQLQNIYQIDSYFPQANITRQNNCWKFHEYTGIILERVSH